MAAKRGSGGDGKGRDRELGLFQPITRRDLLHGAGVAAVAAPLAALSEEKGVEAERVADDYPPGAPACERITRVPTRSPTSEPGRAGSGRIPLGSTSPTTSSWWEAASAAWRRPTSTARPTTLYNRFDIFNFLSEV